MTKKFLIDRLALAFTRRIGLGWQAAASAPDGKTPSDESVCDGLKADGVTKRGIL